MLVVVVQRCAVKDPAVHFETDIFLNESGSYLNYEDRSGNDVDHFLPYQNGSRSHRSA